MSALHGMGGVGKSEVSLEWVYRCKEQKSFEAVFWLQAANLEKLRAGKCWHRVLFLLLDILHGRRELTAFRLWTHCVRAVFRERLGAS